MIKLSIVIPVFNNKNFTQSALNDLFLNLGNNHEIIIVDNASTDGTKEMCFQMMRECNQLEYFERETNTGFAQACNFGYQQSKGENVMFLNNDIRVKSYRGPYWTFDLINAAEQGYLVGPTGGLLDSKFNFIRETNNATEVEYENFYMSGWNLTASKETWKKLEIKNGEVFSTEFGLGYFEDTDLSWRAKQLNIPMKIIPVPVVHLGHMTAKKIGISKLYKEAQKIFIKKWKK